jgi:hypothetical protein
VITRAASSSSTSRCYYLVEPSRLTWFERMNTYMCFVERNILLPCLVLSFITKSAPLLCTKFGAWPGSAIVAVAGFRLMRSAYSHTAQQYVILLFTYVLFQFDFKNMTETHLFDYFCVSVLYYIVRALCRTLIWTVLINWAVCATVQMCYNNVHVLCVGY